MAGVTDIETTDRDPAGDGGAGGIRHDNPIPVPPFWGSRCIEHLPPRAVAPYIKRKTLYKSRRGYEAAGRPEDEYQAFARTGFDPILHRLPRRSERENILRPQPVYGYFPYNADGDDRDKIPEPLGAARIGRVLGDEDQLRPEESTSAIVAHHLQAKYFTM